MSLKTTLILIALVGSIVGSRLQSLRAAEKQPIEVIEDNSFLIEEAYNQEPGVVQHSFSMAYNGDSRRRGWSFNFTQEWPVFFPGSSNFLHGAVVSFRRGLGSYSWSR
jgi:hypothetical protein